MKRILKRLTNWKHWPFSVFYFPLWPAWVQYFIKSKSLWFFSAANPTITMGGYHGETKSEIYRQLPETFLPESILIKTGESFKHVELKLLSSGIRFPFIVKPDMGMKGILFRVVHTMQQLQQYHNIIQADYYIQKFLPASQEISVFYIRMPWQTNGRITAIILKELSHVTGDGKSDLQQLIAANGEVNDVRNVLLKKHKHKLKFVLPAGEKFILSFIANIPNGAMFTNATHLTNEKLKQFFDEVSLRSQFYYGRYDIKSDTIDDFFNLRKFYVLEFNGAGSVPNHVFTGSYTIAQAYSEIKNHWKDMYNISRYNNRNGYAYWNFWRGWKFVIKTNKIFAAMKAKDRQLEW